MKEFLYEVDFSPVVNLGKSFGVFAYNKRLMNQIDISIALDVRSNFKKSWAFISVFKL